MFKIRKYRIDGQMTFQQALNYSKGALKTKKFASKITLRKVDDTTSPLEGPLDKKEVKFARLISLCLFM